MFAPDGSPRTSMPKTNVTRMYTCDACKASEKKPTPSDRIKAMKVAYGELKMFVEDVESILKKCISIEERRQLEMLARSEV